MTILYILKIIILQIGIKRNLYHCHKDLDYIERKLKEREENK